MSRVQGLGEKLLGHVERFKTKQNEKWVNKSKTAIRYHLDRLKSKLAEEKLREIGLGKQNLEKVADALMPSGNPQERVVNVFQFLGLYGPDFVSLCLESLDPEKLCHHVIEIEAAVDMIVDSG